MNLKILNYQYNIHHLLVYKMSIKVITGPMFSGKTLSLIVLIERHQISKRKCILFKYKKDTRYSDTDVVSHNGMKLSAIPINNLDEIDEEIIRKYDCIGIDEGQFFPNIVEFAEKYANMGKHVIIAGLISDFRRESFNGFEKLFLKAEEIIKLNAICSLCYDNEAAFTKRTISSNEQELIGGNDKYISVCRKCYKN